MMFNSDAPHDLHGRPIDGVWLKDRLNAALAAIGRVGPLTSRTSVVEVSEVTVKPMVDTGQSQNFTLSCQVLAQHVPTAIALDLHVKAVDAHHYAAKKTPEALRRDMHSAANEVVFYSGVAPTLCRDGILPGLPAPIYAAASRGFEDDDE